MTGPEVTKAVMQAIEGLTGRSLAGEKMEDWLYRWEYAAADPDHDLGAIDFADICEDTFEPANWPTGQRATNAFTGKRG